MKKRFRSFRLQLFTNVHIFIEIASRICFRFSFSPSPSRVRPPSQSSHHTTQHNTIQNAFQQKTVKINTTMKGNLFEPETWFLLLVTIYSGCVCVCVFFSFLHLCHRLRPLQAGLMILWFVFIKLVAICAFIGTKNLFGNKFLRNHFRSAQIELTPLNIESQCCYELWLVTCDAEHIWWLMCGWMALTSWPPDLLPDSTKCNENLPAINSLELKFLIKRRKNIRSAARSRRSPDSACICRPSTCVVIEFVWNRNKRRFHSFFFPPSSHSLDVTALSTNRTERTY